MRVEVRPELTTAVRVYLRLFAQVTALAWLGMALTTVVREDVAVTWSLLNQLVFWSVMVNLGLVYLFGVFYLFERRKRWWITDTGIDIGTPRDIHRHIPWQQLIRLTTRGHRITLWLNEAPTYEEICFVDRAVAAHVRDLFAGAR